MSDPMHMPFNPDAFHTMKSRLTQLPELFARQDKKLETRIASLYAAQRALVARAMKYALEHSNIG